MSRVDTAVTCFRNGLSCSQAIFTTYADVFGMDRETAAKVAAGFGAGMGRMGEACGAFTGALMVFGLKHGAAAPEDREAREATYESVRDFAQRFKERYGTLTCRDIIHCDLSTPEGLEQARQQQVFTTICAKVVRDVAEMLEEVL